MQIGWLGFVLLCGCTSGQPEPKVEDADADTDADADADTDTDADSDTDTGTGVDTGSSSGGSGPPPASGVAVFSRLGDIDIGVSGTETLQFQQDDLFDPLMVCEITVTLTAVQERTDCPECTYGAWDYEVSNPTVTAQEAAGGCDDLLDQLGLSTLADLDGQTWPRGAGPEPTGHGDQLFVPDNGAWTSVAFISNPELVGALQYAWFIGTFPFGRATIPTGDTADPTLGTGPSATGHTGLVVTGPTGDTAASATGATGTAGPTADTAATLQTADTAAPAPQLSGLSHALHPTILGPVTVSWTQSVATDVVVEYSFDPGSWEQSPVVAGVAGANSQVLIGIPFGETADWRVATTDGVTVVDAPTPITATPHPVGLPTATVNASVSAGWQPTDRYLLTSINELSCGWCAGPYWTFLSDREGRPVWAVRSPLNRMVLFAQVSVSGDHLMWDEVNVFNLSNSKLHRVYLDDEIATIDIPGHHHAVIELPDGTIAWGAKAVGFNERLMELPPMGVAPVEIWNCDDDWPAVNTCTSNCLYYDEPSDSYLYSFYTAESVVSIDRSAGTSSWWSDQFFLNTGSSDPQQYTFDPVDSQFDWQHGVIILDNGNLLISSDDNNSTRAREYQIDHVSGELVEVWNYDPGYEARFNGDIRRLANGNTLHALGARSILYEVDSSNTVVWEVEWSDGKMLGRAEFIDDPYALLSP